LKSSLKLYKPNLLVNLLFDIVKLFNSWYTNSPKLKDLDEKILRDKIAFLKVVEKYLNFMWKLLNLPHIEKM